MKHGYSGSDGKQAQQQQGKHSRLAHSCTPPGQTKIDLPAASERRSTCG